MRRAFPFILLLCFALFGCRQHDTNIHLDKTGKRGYEVKIKIPTEWIEKLRKANSTQDKQLLREFENFISPDTIGFHNNNDLDCLASAMFVDLDDDPGDEVISFLGWDKYHPSFCVFKQLNDKWFLIYVEPVRTFYSAPTLEVANNSSRNKTIYFRRVDGNGSGEYYDSYTFYKLMSGKVYKCLYLPNEVRESGMGPSLEHELEMSFQVNGGENIDGKESDGIWVKYKYSFLYYVNDKECSLVSGEDGVGYTFDKMSRTYKLDSIPKSTDISELTPQKLAYFKTFEDTLFVSAFSDQIKQVLKNGTSLQKQRMRQYLNMVEADKRAMAKK